jgi:ribulose-5-phosphate 4-epimerase/fuculose-1-phosphate aldolase
VLCRTALSCLAYVRLGDAKLGEMTCALGGTHSAVLRANHGPVVAGPDLQAAVFASEELEETAKLAVIGRRTRQLDQTQVAGLVRVFNAPR